MDIDQTISGVRAGRLSILEETLWEWVVSQERSCRLWGWEDAPWWYGERASISAFAGAIWRSGGIALEEYSVEKSNPDSGGKKKVVAGRNDLYFKIGRTDFILEAKQYWPNLRSDAVTNGLRNYLRSAARDVKCMKANGARRLAAVFVAGRIPESLEDDHEDGIETMIAALNDVPGAARAWVFPEGTERLVAGKKTRKWYPGAGILIKEV